MSECSNKSNQSEFDQLLCNTWDEMIKTDAFSYQYSREKCKYKILDNNTYAEKDGPMLGQLNCLRGTNKRPRKHFETIRVPFNNDTFNFKKIPNKEILFKFNFEDG